MTQVLLQEQRDPSFAGVPLLFVYIISLSGRNLYK